MANANPNAMGPNATYILPACVGDCVGDYMLVLGLPGFALVLSSFALGLPGFLDPNMLIYATRNSCEGVCVAVEYRLYYLAQF